MRRLWIAIITVTLLSHALFAAGLSLGLARLGVPRAVWVAALAGAILAAGLPGRLRRTRADRRLPAWRVLLIEEPYYAHWCATVAACPLFVIFAVLTRLAGLADVSLRADALGAYLTALVVCLYALWVRRRWVRVRTLDVTIPGLGPAFEGYRVAHLSDLHIGGLWSRERARRWIDRLRSLDVDLVALTGDYVTRGTTFHQDIAAVLGEMKGRDGAVAVLGNHDYFGDAEPLVALIRAEGVTLLRNEHQQIHRGADALTVAGVDDTWTRRADVARTLAGAPEGVPVLALAHDPRLFPQLARHAVALVLSGHTHWGQIAVPFLATRYNFSSLSYRHHAGLYREGESVLYVSPGLGTTGPPLRLGAPPEITVLRLHAPLQRSDLPAHAPEAGGAVEVAHPQDG